MRSPVVLIAVVTAALLACDEPAEPARVETAYLLDRINGDPPPQPVCADDGGADQELLFESISLLDDETYGRLQRIRIEDNQPIDQEERGDFERTDSTILLLQSASDTVVLTLIDEDGEFLRRIHPCGDTLRYDNVPVAEPE